MLVCTFTLCLFVLFSCFFQMIRTLYVFVLILHYMSHPLLHRRDLSFFVFMMVQKIKNSESIFHRLCFFLCVVFKVLLNDQEHSIMFFFCFVNLGDYRIFILSTIPIFCTMKIEKIEISLSVDSIEQE